MRDELTPHQVVYLADNPTHTSPVHTDPDCRTLRHTETVGREWRRVVGDRRVCDYCADRHNPTAQQGGGWHYAARQADPAEVFDDE